MSDSGGQGGFEGFGIPLPIPAGLVEALAKSHDQAHMAAAAETARVEAFLASLDVEGLMALRAILNTRELGKSVTANFYDGQVVALLRYVHKVDPDTGLDPLADLPSGTP